MTNSKHIRIISPSGHISSDIVDSSRNYLETCGFRVTEGRFVRGEYGRFSGTKQERLEDIVEALTDPSVDIVLCSRGGYGLQQIVDEVSKHLLSQARLPLLIGFSDITCLHSLYAFTDFASMHGLMCKIGEKDVNSMQVQRWLEMLHGEDVCYEFPYDVHQREGQTKGVLIGGNLSVLYGLQGTPYSLSSIILNNKRKGKKNILFLEDVSERHYHIDRMMHNLRLSGVLSQIDGLVVGQFTDIEPDPLMLCSVQDTIYDAVACFDYPVLMDFPAGHGDVNMPFFLNRETLLTVTSRGAEFFQRGYNV